MAKVDIRELLDVMSLEEILEYGDMTEEEAIEILVEYGGLKLPEFLEK